MLYINTNIGDMPLEDYLHITAIQFGFNSCDDLMNNGYEINIRDDEIINIEE